MPTTATITCGHCKAQHASVAEVRACYAQAQIDADERADNALVAAGDRAEATRVAAYKAARDDAQFRNPATEKQIALIRSLLGEGRAATDPAYARSAARVGDGHAIDRQEASEVISHLFTCPKAASVAPAELESGIYRDPGTAEIFKVYRAVHGSGRMCAKRLEMPARGEAKGSWAYLGLASRFVKSDWRMTLEQAKEFGAIYGVCCVCGTTLTKEASIAAGIGPVCASRV